jgi:hypothetical protein
MKESNTAQHEDAARHRLADQGFNHPTEPCGAVVTAPALDSREDIIVSTYALCIDVHRTPDLRPRKSFCRYFRPSAS